MAQVRSESNASLYVEHLEQRQLLSTVVIEAAGTTGEELISVTADNVEVLNETVSQDGSTFTFEVDDALSVSDLRLNFLNDLFEPGVTDRNLTIESVTFNGENFDLNASNVFSTGTWTRADGVVSGFGRGNTLHANGFIEIQVQDLAPGEIQFNGETWHVSRSVSADELTIDFTNNELVISPDGEALSVSREVEIEPGSLVSLQVNAWRNYIQSGPTVAEAGAGAGIDFFDDSGNKIEVTDINGSPFQDSDSFELNQNAASPDTVTRNQSVDILVPENAATAFLWVWVDEFPEGTVAPLRLTDLRLETLVGDTDTEAPTVDLPAAGTQFNIGSPFSESVAFFGPLVLRDNVALPEISASDVTIELINPNGIAIPAAELQVTQVFRSTILLIPQFDTTNPDLIPGEYFLRVSGNDTVADLSGNLLGEVISGPLIGV